MASHVSMLFPLFLPLMMSLPPQPPFGAMCTKQEDRAITKRLVDAGKLLGIDVLDHIIIGSEGAYFSFADENILFICRRKHTVVGVKVMRFSLGRVVATQGALRALEKAEQLPTEFLDRHVNGDWGDVPEADKQENEYSVEHGFRILSAYSTSAGDQIWILTEADRSATTLMLPGEY